MVAGWGDGLGFYVDVVVGVDGEIGVPGPSGRGTEEEDVLRAVTLE